MAGHEQIADIIKGKPYKLTRPFNAGDKRVEEISIDLAGLRPRDLMRFQAGFEAAGGKTDDPYQGINNRQFHAYILAELSGIPLDLIMDDMSLIDFQVLTWTIQGFLLGGGSTEATPEAR